MTYACLIPARGGSKGIPHKNIREVSGKPLIGWSIEAAQLVSKLTSKVYVSSDSDEILSVSESFGAKGIKRPAEFSTDVASSESALLHALNEIEKECGPLKGLVFLQATSPLRTAVDIQNALDEFEKGEYDSLFSASELEDFFIWEKESNGELKSVNYDFRNRKRRQDIKPQFVENGSIYIFKPEILRNTQNRLGGKIGLSLMEKWKVYEIDKEDDIRLVETILKEFI